MDNRDSLLSNKSREQCLDFNGAHREEGLSPNLTHFI